MVHHNVTIHIDPNGASAIHRHHHAISGGLTRAHAKDGAAPTPRPIHVHHASKPSAGGGIRSAPKGDAHRPATAEAPKSSQPAHVISITIDRHPNDKGHARPSVKKENTAPPHHAPKVSIVHQAKAKVSPPKKPAARASPVKAHARALVASAYRKPQPLLPRKFGPDPTATVPGPRGYQDPDPEAVSAEDANVILEDPPAFDYK